MSMPLHISIVCLWLPWVPKVRKTRVKKLNEDGQFAGELVPLLMTRFCCSLPASQCRIPNLSTVYSNTVTVTVTVMP